MAEQTPRQFITALARELADAPEIEYFGDDQFGLTWKNDRLQAGAFAGPDGCEAFLDQAARPVTQVGAAATLLNMIFNDEVVCMAALIMGGGVRYFLVRADDPTAHFNSMDKSRSLIEVPMLSRMAFRSWTGTADFGDAPTQAELGLTGKFYY